MPAFLARAAPPFLSCRMTRRLIFSRAKRSCHLSTMAEVPSSDPSSTTMTSIGRSVRCARSDARHASIVREALNAGTTQVTPATVVASSAAIREAAVLQLSPVPDCALNAAFWPVSCRVTSARVPVASGQPCRRWSREPFAATESTATARALPPTHVHQHASRGRTAAQGVLPGRFYWRRDARHQCAPRKYVPLCCGRSVHWQQRRRACHDAGLRGAPSKRTSRPTSARKATSDNSAAINRRSAPRRRRGRAPHAVEPSHGPSRRWRTQNCLTTRRSQREASPFTQFALTGCALLLVGLGLLQIFGTMVTVKARDETKKKQ